nr:GNAT family protein [Pseudomonas humi]
MAQVKRRITPEALCALRQAHHGRRAYNRSRLSAASPFLPATLLDYAFGDLRLNRLEADIDPRNLASAATLERLGFRHEGLLRQRWMVAGEVSDSALYGLLAEDWAQTRAQYP